MKSIVKKIALAALLASPAAASAGDAIEVDHLGVNNTIVRVPGGSHYLMMPVQDSNEDATVEVLVDGNIVETIRVRLARNKVDFKVPYDLTPYEGRDVLLNIVTPQSRATLREAADDACWNAFELADTIAAYPAEKFRPAYHHAPQWGWMNDPNGMFYKDGLWHLYFQWNPYGSKWQNMTWGHATSADLIHWQQHPAAIVPNGIGTIFSGSCAIDPHGTAGAGDSAVVALYTQCSYSQVQSMAVSHDNGYTFDICPANPILTLDSEARDPNMFFNQATGRWNMALAHALEHEMLFFSSENLRDWTLESAFGKGIGAQGGVWECPDLFPLTCDGTTKWVLLCNINPGGPFGGSATQYFVGEFDGHSFKADTDASGNIPTKWLDYGKDHYATVSWSDAPDGRRSVIGWMSNWQYAAEVPTLTFRSANTLPREMRLFKAEDGQYYVASEPSPELTALRGKACVTRKSLSVSDKGRTFALPADGLCEITADIDARSDGKAVFELSNSRGEHTTVIYDAAANTLSVDRRESGITDFSHEFPCVTTAPAFGKDGHLSLRLFLDRASIEVFGNGGRATLTNIIFPNEPYTTLTVKGSRARVSDLNVYTINAE